MRSVRKVIGMGIAALTDAAVGIFVVHIISKAFGYDIPLYFYLIGMFLSLLPDLDYAYKLWQKWRGEIKVITTHKAFPHYPIIMIVPICSVLGILSIFGPIFGYWAVVSFLCLLSHYIHDSIEAQTGMRWLFPIDSKYYRFFTEKGGKVRVLCSFTEREIQAKTFLDDTGWIERHYLRLTKESIIGIILFAGAIILAILW